MVLYGRVLEMTGDILEVVRKKGNKMMPFHNEDVRRWSRLAGEVVQSPALAIFKTGA